MSSPDPKEAKGNPPDQASFLFQQLVVHQTEMALMLMGAMPNPETGQRMVDLDSAKLFIDQLEMLALKTRGNLSPLEDEILKASLTHARLVYVEAVNAMPSVSEKATPAPTPAVATTPPPPPPPAPPKREPEPPVEEEPKVRYSKKY